MTIELTWRALWVIPLIWCAVTFVVNVSTWREATEAGKGFAVAVLLGLLCCVAAAYAILQQL